MLIQPDKKVKRKVGRPSKYRTEFPSLVYEYIKRCKEVDDLPMIKDFCRKNDINVDKIEQYCKLNNQFQRAIQELKNEAERYLVVNGLKRKVDSGFAKFILAANYGYVETSKTITEGKTEPVIIRVDMGNGYKPPVTTMSPLQSTTEPSEAKDKETKTYS